MRILFVLSTIWLPSFGGSIKATRCLAEELAARGHKCAVFSHAFGKSAEGPTDILEFFSELERRKCQSTRIELNLYRYHYNDAVIDAHCDQHVSYLTKALHRRINDFIPNCIVVADDPHMFLISEALQSRYPVVHLAQTLNQLPFGPLSRRPNKIQTLICRKVTRTITISNFAQRYMRQYGDLHADVICLPVYGKGPYPSLGQPDKGYITMINPCEEKGVSIFIAMANSLPHLSFAAVLTWGGGDSVLRKLEVASNITILKPSEEITDILCISRIVVVPSLWPETFGYVVPEALLHGIPVLASDQCGLREAALGTAMLIPIQVARINEGQYHFPSQDVIPWVQALSDLASNSKAYLQISELGRKAAIDFIKKINIKYIENFFSECIQTHKA